MKVNCNICHKKYDPRGLPAHRKAEHPKEYAAEQTSGGEFECKDCHTPFRNQYQLSKHRRLEHPRGAAANGAPAASKTKTGLAVNFCPQCGCNLHAVSVALSL